MNKINFFLFLPAFRILFFMQLLRTEGIILQERVFQDYDAILTVFSTDLGVIKMIAKGAHRPQKRSSMVTTPLTHAEFVYTQGRSELLKCSEISVKRHSAYLRHTLPVLESACDMAQAVCLSQWPDKASPNLYLLLNSYLENLHQMVDPYVLASSFRLKLLRHDGLLKLQSKCSVCSELLPTHYIAAGESVCAIHASEHAVAFSADEIAVVYLLAHCRVFSEIADLVLEPLLRQKIIQLFASCIQ